MLFLYQPIQYAHLFRSIKDTYTCILEAYRLHTHPIPKCYMLQCNIYDIGAHINTIHALKPISFELIQRQFNSCMNALAKLIFLSCSIKTPSSGFGSIHSLSVELHFNE